MNRNRSDAKARAVLSGLVLCGIGMLSIPFFLTPPAYLDLVLRDPVFSSDLSVRQASVTQDSTGRLFKPVVQKIAGEYVAHVGRIDSGAGAFTVQVDGFRSGTAHVDAAPLQQTRASVELRPQFGRLQITPVNATTQNEPVASATVRDGTRVLTADPQNVVTIDLPAGTRKLSAQAPGFCPSEHDFEVREGRITTARFPLSPDLQADEIARFVLGWTNEPRDLDSHFRRLGTTGVLNSAHAYFAHKDARDAGGLFARLDVDERRPEGYETVTVRDTATGDFEYYVHLYEGSGTIGGSGATVQVYTRGCSVRTFAPPPGCSQNIWAVTNLRNTQGHIEFIDQQRCEEGKSLLFGGKAPLSVSALLPHS